MSGRAGYLLRRLGWALIVVIGVGSVSFVMARQLPGDPVRMILGPQAAPEDVARARRIYGLDRGVAYQYARYWQRLLHTHGAHEGEETHPDHASCGVLGPLHVDLGYSYRYRKPVVELIATRAPRSLELALAALLFQSLLALGAGITAARTRGRAWDQLVTGASLVGVSVPIFALGLMLQYVFAERLGWLPHDGYGQTPAEQLRSLVLPAFTLGLFGAALYTRLLREELSQVLASDYIRTARAKGAPAWRIMAFHALRNAMVPVATLMVLELGSLIGGAIVTEKLFRWPGMGAMAVDAMVNRDAPVIFGTVMFSALAIVLASLLVDVVPVLIAPRLEHNA